MDAYKVLKSEYGKELKIKKDQDDNLVNITKTKWYKKIKNEVTPGINLRIYRTNHGYTQKTLGDLLGGIPRQHVSNMENDIRPISKKMAKRLSKIFKVSVEKFI
ncbi:MAG: helix-turn-helix transcriptional regulator [Spirochaetes bacterium]|nr:helix-turn-helix transcriptional regulator [Spirochaetota bacterium]